jgi:hypothetical protein
MVRLEVRVHYAMQVNGAMEALTTGVIMHLRPWQGVTTLRTVYVTRGGMVRLEVRVHYAIQVNGAMEARTTRVIMHPRQ